MSSMGKCDGVQDMINMVRILGQKISAMRLLSG